MPRLYIGGPSGCGKTAVVKDINSRHPHICCFSGSQIMMQAAEVTREELNLLPESIKNTLRETAFLSYYEKNSNLILEGHFFLTEIDARFINSFIFIEASVDSLIFFRKSDKNRVRGIESGNIKNEIKELEERIKAFEKKFEVEVIRVANNSTLDILVSKVLALYSSISGTIC